MSSLGYQAIYHIFNEQPGTVCERAFLPDPDEMKLYEKSGDTLVSIESERPLSDFDVIAFSVSFEPDFINIPRIMKLARIPVISSERDESLPLVIGGGAALFINPEPVADFFDIIAIGEGEKIVPELTRLLMGCSSRPRNEIMEAASSIDGAYIPSADHKIPVKRVCSPPDTPPQCSVIITDETEFGNMYLVEVSRGCPRGCRFCVAGFAWQPFRQHPVAGLKASCLEGLKHRKTIGLVGAAVSDHPDIEELCEFIVDNGGSPSLSSLRIDRITPSLLKLLAKSGHRTLSLAPEGPSQRMRDLVRKNLNALQVVEAAGMVASSGILNLRLYFIIGLPGETDQDLDEMVSLVSDVRERFVAQSKVHGRLGEITLSVNPFIPKPFTPLQWAPFCPLTELKKKAAFLEKRLRPFSNVRLKMEDLHGALLQALISKGDRHISTLIIKMSEGINLRKASRIMGINPEEIASKRQSIDSRLPWEVICMPERERLLNEYTAAMKVAGVEP